MTDTRCDRDYDHPPHDFTRNGLNLRCGTTERPGTLGANKWAAERLLKAAVRRAAELVREGQDPAPVLAAAEISAALLLGDAA